MKVTALVFDVLVDSPELLHCFPAPVTGFLSAANCSLYPAKLRLCSFIIAGIFNGCAVTQDRKARQSHINTSDCSGCWYWGRGFSFDTETDIPLPTRFFQGDSFDAAGDFPVQLYLEFPNALNIKLLILWFQLAPVAIFWERVTVKPGDALKSWIAWFLPSFYSAKKGVIRVVYPAQDVLATGVICQREVASSPDVPQLVCLLVVGKGRFSHLPGIPAL